MLYWIDFQCSQHPLPFIHIWIVNAFLYPFYRWRMPIEFIFFIIGFLRLEIPQLKPFLFNNDSDCWLILYYVSKLMNVIYNNLITAKNDDACKFSGGLQSINLCYLNSWIWEWFMSNGSKEITSFLPTLHAFIHICVILRAHLAQAIHLIHCIFPFPWQEQIVSFYWKFSTSHRASLWIFIHSSFRSSIFFCFPLLRHLIRYLWDCDMYAKV